MAAKRPTPVTTGPDMPCDSPLPESVPVRGEAREREIDDIGDEPVAQRCVAVQQSVVDGAPDDVLGELDTNARPEFAALACPFERCLGHVAAWPEQPGEVLLREDGVAVHLGDERAEDARVVARAELPDPRSQQRDEVTAQRPGV